MKKEIAMKWVEALRSGEYKQGKGSLKDDFGRHCCLGVLREIGYAPNSSGAGGMIEPVDQMHCGFNMQELTGSFNASVHALANLNDYGCSFDEIADLIEVCWEEL